MRVGAAIVGAVLSVSIAQGAVSASNADEGLQFQDVKDVDMRAEAMKSLNDGLHRIARDAEIRGCPILMWSQPGRVEAIYGGICELKTGNAVAICGDTGVGEFGLAENFSPTKDGVAEFVRSNCPGG